MKFQDQNLAVARALENRILQSIDEVDRRLRDVYISKAALGKQLKEQSRTLTPWVKNRIAADTESSVKGLHNYIDVYKKFKDDPSVTDEMLMSDKDIIQQAGEVAMNKYGLKRERDELYRNVYLWDQACVYGETKKLADKIGKYKLVYLLRKARTRGKELCDAFDQKVNEESKGK